MKAFLKKVEAERALLRVINENHALPELTGTSMAAVDEWRRQSVPQDLAEDVICIATKISGLAERSGERFDERHEGESTSIQTEIEALSHKLGRREQS